MMSPGHIYLIPSANQNGQNTTHGVGYSNAHVSLSQGNAGILKRSGTNKAAHNRK